MAAPAGGAGYWLVQADGLASPFGSSAFDKRTQTRADGTWRVDPPGGRYTVVVAWSKDGRVVSGATDLDVTTGRAYRIDARLQRSGGFLVMPVSGY
jgi:hypothetical protein